MTAKIYPVVMSGGAGTRLWPLSRADRPKQLHALTGARSMLAETLARFARPPGAPVEFGGARVICAAGHMAQARQAAAAGKIALDEIILEPQGRNTAPAAVFAALSVAEKDPHGLALLSPADHYMARAEALFDALPAAAAAAADHLVAFGITPSRAETGYGYIRRGAALAGANGVFRIDAFVEKPDQETAESYLRAGVYDWNAGIFLYRPQLLLAEMEMACPALLAGAKRAFEAARLEGGVRALPEAEIAACPAQSIDYALMEKTDRAAVAPVDPAWSDVGSWNAAWEIAERDASGVAKLGDVMAIETQNSYFRSEGPLIAALGVEGLVVVAMPDAVFVAPRDRAQDVREIVAELKAQGRFEAERVIDLAKKRGLMK